MTTKLSELYDRMQARGDYAAAENLRNMACYEFTYRLETTVSWARHFLSQVVKNRRPWISDVQHARRVAALADIEATVINPVAELAA